jgi:hypothetical protein
MSPGRRMDMNNGLRFGSTTAVMVESRESAATIDRLLRFVKAVHSARVWYPWLSVEFNWPRWNPTGRPYDWKVDGCG